MKTIKSLYRLQTASIDNFIQIFGHYQGRLNYNLLHGKCKGNIIIFYLHSGSDTRNAIDRELLPKNVKLTKLVTS